MSGELVPVEAEIAQIETDIATPGSDYWRSEQKQARLRELYAARENGTPAPKQDAKDQELIAIEKLMAQPGSSYWKGPLAIGLQERFRQLHGGSPAAADAGGDGWRASVSEVQTALPAAAEAWGDDMPDALPRAQDRATTLAAILGPEGWVEESSTFAGLPDPVQGALLSELGRQSPGYVPTASAADMTLFRASVPGGDALIQAWGREANRRVSAVLDAGQRIDARLDPAQRSALAAWWNHAPLKSRMAMVYAIGNA